MHKFKGLILSILAAVVLLPPDAMGQTPRTATATATVVNGFIVAITVTDGGFGYTAVPTVKISASAGVGAAAVATILNGSVDKITITEVGNGYGVNPSVTVSPPAASRTATGTATVVNGFLVSISVTDGGYGYTIPPSVTLSGGAGAGAELVTTISNGAVDQILVVNAGTGYASTTSVTISPPAVAVAPFSDGLVAYYSFNGTAKDQSGNGNDGAIMDASMASDRFGASSQCLFFPGYGYVYVSNTAATESLRTLTVSAWVKHDGLGSGPNGVSIASKVSDDSSALAWNLSIAPTGKLRLSANVGSWSYFQCETVLEAGVWYHVAMAYDGLKLTGFVNGRLDGISNLPGSLAPSTRPIRIGAYSPTLGPDDQMFFVGKIDEVRIYNRALSDQEINDLYHFEAPEGPWLELKVKTVEVTMHVKPNKTYRLQTAADMSHWTDVGEPFVATSSIMVQEFSGAEAARYFRLSEVR